MRSWLKGAAIVGAIVVTKLAFLNGALDHDHIRQLVDQAGPLAVPGFILLAVVGHVLCAPPVLSIGSGVLAFGTRLGTIYSLVAMTLASALAFSAGRSLLREWALRRKHPLLDRVDLCAERKGLILSAGLKLALFANPPLNYAAGVTSIRMRDYLIGGLLGLIPGVYVISNAFEQWMMSTSFLGILVHPAVATMVFLRLLGGVVIAVTVKATAGGRSPVGTPAVE